MSKGRKVIVKHDQKFTDGRLVVDKMDITIWEDSLIARDIIRVDVSDVPNLVKALQEKYEQTISTVRPTSQRKNNIRGNACPWWRKLG